MTVSLKGVPPWVPPLATESVSPPPHPYGCPTGAPWPWRTWRGAIWQLSPTRSPATCTRGLTAPRGVTTPTWRCQLQGGGCSRPHRGILYKSPATATAATSTGLSWCLRGTSPPVCTSSLPTAPLIVSWPWRGWCGRASTRPIRCMGTWWWPASACRPTPPPCTRWWHTRCSHPRERRTRSGGTCLGGGWTRALRGWPERRERRVSALQE